MVSTVTLTTHYATTFGSRLSLSFLIIIHMSAIDGTTVFSERETDSKAKRTIFPSEEPSEIELQDYCRDWENVFREGNLLQYITEHPVKTADYSEKPEIIAPADASVTLKASITVKNLEQASLNAERNNRWLELIRGKNDTAAAMLTASLRPKADMRLKELVRRHTYRAPHSNQINGGAMFRAIKGLKGHLDSEEQEDACFKAYVLYLRDHPLPSNATAQQFADRCNEFENDINPNLAV